MRAKCGVGTGFSTVVTLHVPRQETVRHDHTPSLESMNAVQSTRNAEDSHSLQQAGALHTMNQGDGEAGQGKDE